ncbi:DNA repair protein [Deinococcus detaillensis]|uniref:DNA repair protein n=1 Tax=Deinococcus detaillensis TaxID=2592048 RepID=A0A553V4U3_9DEIO|nr:DNA repair protein [Deinococcus detaillensis]TSA87462.1 DNA repair protein [Deinococcus detaillensis]
MTQAPKPKKEAVQKDASSTAANSALSSSAAQALQGLLRTALPDLSVANLSAEQLSAALSAAHEVWGYGLRHVKHEIRLEDGGAVGLYADRARLGSASDSAEMLADAYSSMQALDEQGRSAWAVLPEGHRVTLEAGTRQIKVLVEDARDFETHWAELPSGLAQRTGRSGEDLWVEVFRAAPGRELVQDAAWEVVERIKDRALRRELQRRAEEKGILGALLGARGEGIEAAMKRSPSLHFTVNAAVTHTTERSFEAWRSIQKEAAAALEANQQAQVERLVALLGSPARGR